VQQNKIDELCEDEINSLIDQLSIANDKQDCLTIKRIVAILFHNNISVEFRESGIQWRKLIDLRYTESIQNRRKCI